MKTIELGYEEILLNVTVIKPDGTKYEGDIQYYSFHGQGILTYSDGSIYMGEFEYGKKHGQGAEVRVNGSKYQGEFKDGCLFLLHALSLFYRPLLGYF